jgi:hypothetical protein
LRSPFSSATVARATLLGAAGVERRVEVRQRGAAVRLGAQQRQVVAQQDPVLHGGERTRRVGG